MFGNPLLHFPELFLCARSGVLVEPEGILCEQAGASPILPKSPEDSGEGKSDIGAKPVGHISLLANRTRSFQEGQGLSEAALFLAIDASPTNG